MHSSIQEILDLKSLSKRTDLIAIARKGIETKFITDIQEYTSLTEKELISILPISLRQLLRYSANHRLNKEITSHLIQIVDLFSKGYELFGRDKFILWIRTNNKVLSGLSPIEIMDTSIGIEMIEDVIGRIEHGVYS